MNTSLTTSDTTPCLEEHKSIVAMATPRNRRNSEASLLVLQEGEYLLAYTAFSASPRDDTDATVMAIRSYDCGFSWSDPEPIAVKQGGGLNMMSPSLIRLPDGSIGFACIAKESVWVSKIIWKQSWDEGKTWSADRAIYDAGEHTGSINDALVLLESGRVLLPLYERVSGGEPRGDDLQMRAFCLYSDDFGKSWHRSEGWITFTGAGACEPCVYESTPRHLVMYCRSSVGHLLRSDSTDNGISWSPAETSAFEAACAPSAVRRRPGTSEVFIVRNPKWYPDLLSGGPRVPLALTISRDQGATWAEHPELLESDYTATFSYPSIAFDQQYLLLTYYHTRFRVSLADHPDLNISLCFRRIPLSRLGTYSDTAAEVCSL